MLKLFSMFSGFGGAEYALKQAGIDFELIGFSEVDKYAIQIYQQNHGGQNYGDCTKINPNELPDFDLLTGGFPCQAFSLAGAREGLRDPRGTLFWDIIRIAEVKHPKYMLLENVKGLLSIDDGETFKSMIHELNRIGYDVRYKILNTKDYGVPQNRERIWFVCKYGSWDFMEFQFPYKKKLEISIKDILEPIIDKKYFLSPTMQKRFDEYLADKKIDDNTCIDAGVQRRGEWGEGIHDSVSGTLNSASGRDFLCLHYESTIEKDMGDNFPVVFDDYNKRFKNDGIMPAVRQTFGNNSLGNGAKIYDRKGFDSRTKGFRESELSPTLSTKMGTGGNNVPMISNTSKKEMGFREVSPVLCARDYKDPKIISGTITGAFGRSGCSDEENRSREAVMKASGCLRRLTPRECFRLQGFLKDEINITNISDSQLYKIAGNGWSINVATAIIKEMFKNAR